MHTQTDFMFSLQGTHLRQVDVSHEQLDSDTLKEEIRTTCNLPAAGNIVIKDHREISAHEAITIRLEMLEENSPYDELEQHQQYIAEALLKEFGEKAVNYYKAQLALA